MVNRRVLPIFYRRWVASFLDNRQQRVKIGNTFSLWLDFKGSIVQGSWLGPKLFITILINLVVELPTHKFMDDTTITESISCVEDSKIQSVANQVLSISDENRMKLNAKKTNTMTIDFHRTKKIQIPPVSIDGTELEQVSCFKLLGLNIFDDLKWKEHIDIMCRNANKRIYFLKRLRHSGMTTEELTEYYVTYNE